MKAKLLRVLFAGVMLLGPIASCSLNEPNPPSSTPSSPGETPSPGPGPGPVDPPLEEKAPGDVDFNFGWTFKEVSPQQFESEALKPYEVGFNDDSWKKVDLPYDWSIEKDFDPNVNSITGHLLGGYGWYRKKFTLPESYRNKRITITFNGVYMESTVYLNGQRLGFYPSGYVPFTYDLTGKLNFGDVPNEIAVSSINTEGTSRWYSGAGIYRDVTLRVAPLVHIATNGTTVNYPDLKKNHEAANEGSFSATASVENELVNDSSSERTVTVKATLLDYATGLPVEGVSPATSEPIVLKPGEARVAKTDLVVSNPKLWSPDSPNLYTISSEVIEGEEVIETSNERIGFRYFDWYSKIEAEKLNKSPMFYLNGKVLNFNGVSMHHDQGALGASAYKEAIYRQMLVMKEMGVNALRVTHNVADPTLLQICDELGIVVIEEFFDSWYTPKASRDFARFFEQQSTHPDAQEGQIWAEFDIKSVVKRDKNVPSIIMWSVGNEIPDSHDFASAEAEAKAIRTIQNLVSWAHSADVDPTDETRATGQRRFVTIGQNPSNPTAIPIMNELDAVGYNYWFQYGNNPQTQRPWQDSWRWYGSETSSSVKSRGFYAQGGGESTRYAYVTGYGEQLSSWDNSSVPWGATATYELKRQQTTPGIGGEFVWTGFDYIGEPTPWYSIDGRKSPVKSYFGIVDTAGFAKDDYYLYQSQWRSVEEHPMVHIVSHLNWENETLRSQFQNADGTIPLKVYSNASKVELFIQEPNEVGARSLGAKEFVRKQVQNGPDHVKTYQRSKEDENVLFLKWDVAWSNPAPGTRIFAKAYDASGNEIAQSELNKTDRVEGLNVAQQQITTAGKAAKVSLRAERKDTLTADGYDLIYLDATVQDAQGNFVPTAMNGLEFKLLGNQDAAEIFGVDNGDASSWERHKGYQTAAGISWRRSAFNGRALAIVKAKRSAGAFSVQVTGDNIQGDVISLASVAPTTPLASTASIRDGLASLDPRKREKARHSSPEEKVPDAEKTAERIGG